MFTLNFGAKPDGEADYDNLRRTYQSNIKNQHEMGYTKTGPDLHRRVFALRAHRGSSPWWASWSNSVFGKDSAERPTAIELVVSATGCTVMTRPAGAAQSRLRIKTLDSRCPLLPG